MKIDFLIFMYTMLSIQRNIYYVGYLYKSHIHMVVVRGFSIKVGKRSSIPWDSNAERWIHYHRECIKITIIPKHAFLTHDFHRMIQNIHKTHSYIEAINVLDSEIGHIWADKN